MSESSWKTRKLKNLPIQIIDGDRSARYPKRNEFVNNGILFLNTTNIENNRIDLSSANFVSKEKFLQIKKGRLQQFDVVMTTRGSIGKVALFDCGVDTGLINAQMLILRADGSEIDPQFLFHVLSGDEMQARIRNFASGSAQPQIPIQDLREIELTCPSFPMQRRIASILSAYDDFIEKNTRRITILEEMAQLLYEEWFVKFRFPGHEKVKMVESEFGSIPEGWEVSNIANIATVYRGRSYKGSELRDNGGVPFLNLKCIQRDGGFRRDGIKRYTGDFKDTQTAVAGNVIIAVTDMTQERRLVARAARVPQTREPLYVFSMDLVKVAPQGVPGDYLYCLLRFSKFADEVKQHANGVNVLHLSPQRIEEFRFCLAPPILRQKFADLVAPIFAISDVLAAEQSILRQTRDLLLPKLISGEIDVQNLDIKMPPENGAAMASIV